MGLMDAINPDAKVELKVGDLYSVLDAAAVNGRTAKFLINAVNCEVPYRYIREMITGEKEDGKKPDPVVMSAEMQIHASELARVVKETILQEVSGARKDADLPFPDPVHEEGVTDCAPEGVGCDECPHPCEGESEVEE